MDTTRSGPAAPSPQRWPGAVRGVSFPWQGSSGAIMCAVGVVVAVALARGPRQRWITPLALVAVVPVALAGNDLSELALTA